MRQIAAIMLVLLPALLSAKQKTVEVEYLYHIPENVSPDEARATAFSRAQAQAIADEFGTIVVQSNSVTVENYNGTGTIDYLSIGGSELKGEWVETIGSPEYEFLTDGNQLAVRVKAKGKIREVEGNRVPFCIKLLRNGTDDINESETFHSGDDLYISFRAPSAGYISIYLIDAEKHAYCLLPYLGQENGIFPTKANHRYLFFHPDHATDLPKEIVDQFTLETPKERERNRILTIFSPNKFYKAVDNRTAEDLPRNLSYEDLQKWLSNLRKHDTDLTISEKSILIVQKL